MTCMHFESDEELEDTRRKIIEQHINGQLCYENLNVERFTYLLELHQHRLFYKKWLERLHTSPESLVEHLTKFTSKCLSGEDDYYLLGARDSMLIYTNVNKLALVAKQEGDPALAVQIAKWTAEQAAGYDEYIKLMMIRYCATKEFGDRTDFLEPPEGWDFINNSMTEQWHQSMDILLDVTKDAAAYSQVETVTQLAYDMADLYKKFASTPIGQSNPKDLAEKHHHRISKMVSALTQIHDYDGSISTLPVADELYRYFLTEHALNSSDQEKNTLLAPSTFWDIVHLYDLVGEEDKKNDLCKFVQETFPENKTIQLDSYNNPYDVPLQDSFVDNKKSGGFINTWNLTWGLVRYACA